MYQWQGPEGLAHQTSTNVRHTRAIVTALLEFLYKWMPLHLVYTIATLVYHEETQRWPYKAVSDLSLSLLTEVKRK